MTETEQILFDALVELLVAARSIEDLGKLSKPEHFAAYLQAQVIGEQTILNLEDDIYTSQPSQITLVQ